MPKTAGRGNTRLAKGLETFRNETLHDPRISSTDSPRDLLDFLKTVAKEERELLFESLGGCMPTWFPFEDNINPPNVFGGDVDGTYLLFRALLIQEQCRGLKDGARIFKELVAASPKAAFQDLAWDKARVFLRVLLENYVRNANSLGPAQQVRMALVVRWAKWFGDLALNSRDLASGKSRFQEGIVDLVQDVVPDAADPMLSLTSLVDLMYFGRRLGTFSGLVPWNVVPARWWRRNALRNKKTGISAWTSVATDVKASHPAPLGILCEVVLYPFIETVTPLGEALGACYASGKFDKTPIQRSQLRRVFLESHDDMRWHLDQIGSKVWISSFLPEVDLTNEVL